MKQKILIVGLPRSGTTIISNTINSLKNAFCFIEPHWEKSLKGKVSFDDKKLKWIWGLDYYSGDALPLDHAITKILNKYDLVGFKETFRSNIYESFYKNISNQDLLFKYKTAGYKIIPIIRNPLNVWNSNKSFNPDKDSWAGRLDLFIQNYCDFINFIKPLNPIIFERFVQFPEKTLKEFGLDVPNKIEIQSRKLKMGDVGARSSTKIEHKKKELLYTEEEKQIIEKSEAMEKYKSFYTENAQN